MKEFVEKLIERLEELKEDSINENCPVVPNSEDSEMEHSCASCFLNASIKIVNQLAEEYNPPKSRGLENGWIPCSERLPEVLQWVLIQTKQGDMDVVKYIGETKCWGYDFYHRIHQRMVIAWQPLPKPYKPEQQKEMPTDHFTERFNRVV